MIYQNTKTGAMIDVKSVISGGNWLAVKPASQTDEVASESKTKRKGAKTKNE